MSSNHHPAGASATASSSSIVSRGLTRRFGETLAVAPFDVEIGGDDAPGTVVGLLGPNGSGKSTLLRMLTGLVRPDAGTAVVAGVKLSGDGTAVRKRVTYSPGELHLYGEMRAHKHLVWLLRGRDPASVGRATELANRLGLPLERRVRAYSHGMKRQLVFVAAMGPDVGIRILDEPTEGLDPSRRSEVLDILEEDARRGTTILLSSHHLGEVDRICRRLLFMNAGELIADETPASVRERSARLIRLEWDESLDMQALTRDLTFDCVESIRQAGTSLSILLRDRDPRAFLRELGGSTQWPAPLRIDHGRLSLSELYRELYGVEGC